MLKRVNWGMLGALAFSALVWLLAILLVFKL